MSLYLHQNPFIMRKLTLLILFLGVVVLQAQPKLRVVGTTTFIADMAKNIAGDKAEVLSLMPIGGDPHTYEPVPGDAQKIENADIILKNGLTLEGWLDEMIQNSGTKAQIYTLTEGIEAINSADHKGAMDPHAWMSAKNGLIYIQHIKEALITFDPGNTAVYEANYQAYKSKLLALDTYITQQINKIPQAQRILITSHDAFRYYGNQYGIRVESVIGTSTDAEVRFEDIQHLNTVIAQHNIQAIFIESTINPKLMNQISQDKQVKIGGKLFADSLGDEESGASTYWDMLKQNTDTIVAGLLGAKALKKEEETHLSFIFIIGALFFITFLGVSFLLKSKHKQNLTWNNYTIDIQKLTVSYDKRIILSNLFLTIESGHVYGLIGGNGSGKSTLMKSLVGLISPDTGNITINGQKIDDIRPFVAYVPQKEEIDWSFPATVMDVVMMGRYPYRKVFEGFTQQDRQLAIDALHKMGISDLMTRQIGELSGGQQQRVFIARALCQEAEVFLFDEPFVGVDITTEEKIMEIVRKLANEGKLVVIIHHDLAKIKAYFDRLIMINHRIIAVGDTEAVFTEDNIQKTYGGMLPVLQMINNQILKK